MDLEAAPGTVFQFHGSVQEVQHLAFFHVHNIGVMVDGLAVACNIIGVQDVAGAALGDTDLVILAALQDEPAEQFDGAGGRDLVANDRVFGDGRTHQTVVVNGHQCGICQHAVAAVYPTEISAAADTFGKPGQVSAVGGVVEIHTVFAVAGGGLAGELNQRAFGNIGGVGANGTVGVEYLEVFAALGVGQLCLVAAPCAVGCFQRLIVDIEHVAALDLQLGRFSLLSLGSTRNVEGVDHVGGAAKGNAHLVVVTALEHCPGGQIDLTGCGHLVAHYNVFAGRGAKNTVVFFCVIAGVYQYAVAAVPPLALFAVPLIQGSQIGAVGSAVEGQTVGTVVLANNVGELDGLTACGALTLRIGGHSIFTQAGVGQLELEAEPLIVFLDQRLKDQIDLLTLGDLDAVGIVYHGLGVANCVVGIKHVFRGALGDLYPVAVLTGRTLQSSPGEQLNSTGLGDLVTDRYVLGGRGAGGGVVILRNQGGVEQNAIAAVYPLSVGVIPLVEGRQVYTVFGVVIGDAVFTVVGGSQLDDLKYLANLRVILNLDRLCDGGFCDLHRGTGFSALGGIGHGLVLFLAAADHTKEHCCNQTEDNKIPLLHSAPSFLILDGCCIRGCSFGTLPGNTNGCGRNTALNCMLYTI